MLEEECCSNCLFYMSNPKVCRRYPPKAIMVGVKKGIASLTGDEPMIMSYFPTMMSNGWCGEYKSEEKSEIEN